MTWL
jgi:hypothetical protein